MSQCFGDAVRERRLRNTADVRMQLAGLPDNFKEWQVMREEHLVHNLVSSDFTTDLYKQYRKHLGLGRYAILKQVQLLLVPGSVKKILSLGKIPWIAPVLQIYKLLRLIKLEASLKHALLPAEYKAQILELDMVD